MCLMDVDQACREAGIARHVVRFSSTIIVDDPGPASKTAEKIFQKIKRYTLPKIFKIVRLIELFSHLEEWSVQLTDGAISVESVIVNVDSSENDKKNILVSWTNEVCAN